MSKLDALEDELDAAVDAFKRHVKSGVVIWWGDKYPGKAEQPMDAAWMAKWHELRDRRDRAEAAVLDYLTRPKHEEP